MHFRIPSANDLDEHIKSMLQWADEINTKAKENIKKAQVKPKKRYDAHKKPDFSVEDKIWRYNSCKQTRQGGKLEFNWDGPYEIAEQTTRGTYKLKNNSGKILKQGISSINL